MNKAYIVLKLQDLQKEIPTIYGIIEYLNNTNSNIFLHCNNKKYIKYIEKMCYRVIALLDIERNVILNDDYIFKIGKYKGYKLKDVPDNYVKWFKAKVSKRYW